MPMLSLRPSISRRAFAFGVSATAGAVLLTDTAFADAEGSPSESKNPEITVWVVIEPDDTTRIRVARSEMGQGALTSWQRYGQAGTPLPLLNQHPRTLQKSRATEVTFCAPLTANPTQVLVYRA